MKKLVLAFISFLIASTAFSITPTMIDSVPMRDGKKLAADVYLTPNSSTAPTIFIFTPYGRVFYQVIGLPLGIGQSMSNSNYNIIIVDWRCRFGSTAACVAQPDNGQDGYDVVQWIAQQPWSDGQVGMWGPSALGKVQFLTAKENPAALKCIVPLVAAPQYEFTEYYPGGVYRTEYVQQLDVLGFGMSSWLLLNQTRNLFWQYTESVTDFPDSIRVPALMIGGWYDHTPVQMLEFFNGIRSQSPVNVRDQHRLLMGPWSHGGSGQASVGTAQQGQLNYANAAGWNDSLALLFFDYHLRGSNNNWNNSPYVQYYQMGDNSWMSSTAWPPAGMQNIDLYLKNGGGLDGYTPANVSGSATYAYDPRDPSPTIGGPTLLTALDQGPYDQAPQVESRNDILIFNSVVLPQDVVMKGRAQANLFVSSDQYDTDFAVRITDVYPSGESMYVVDGIARLRFRNGFAPADTVNMIPGQIYPVTIDFPPTAITFKAGHRIRVDITSSIYPQYDCNLNDGGPMYVAGDTTIANNTVYFNSSYPSSVTFPLVDFAAGAQELTAAPGLSVYPNPTVSDSWLRVESREAQEIKIAVVDLNGRTIESRSENVSAGTSFVNLGSSSLPAGMYFVQVSGNSFTASRKLVKN